MEWLFRMIFVKIQIMRFITTLLLLFVSAISVQAQWNKTNLSGSRDIAVHDGKVYALTTTLGLQVSADNGDTWTEVNTSAIADRKDFVVSSGNRLYIATYGVSNAHGTLYYTTDEGANWTTDTVGLPDALFQPPGKGDVRSIHAFDNGEIIGTFGGQDAYYHKNNADASWSIIPDLADLDPDNYASSGDTVIAFGSSPIIKYSTDHCESFQSITATGLPSYFVTSDVYWDKGGRIYLGVNASIISKTQLYYSDDFCATWDSLNIDPFVGVNFTSTRQLITSVFAMDNHVYFALNNDAGNTTADIFSSSDGGQSFIKDTAGLTVDNFFTENVLKFVWNDNRLFNVCSNTDVHYTDLDGIVGINSSVSDQQISIYPNPSSGLIHFSQSVRLLQLVSADGRLLASPNKPVNNIDLSPYPKGIYFVRIEDTKGLIQHQKIVLE
jgi:hypothetical protein